MRRIIQPYSIQLILVYEVDLPSTGVEHGNNE